MSETVLSLERAVALAATGDIWLFRGTSMADLTIRTATNSPVNHVGMTVAIDDLPPLLWHAELGRSLPDVWTGQRQRGVQLHVLADAVRNWKQRYGQQAWVRQLEGEVTREQEDRLMEIIDRFDGKPFPTMVGMVRRRLTGRWRRKLVAGDGLLRRAGGDHLSAHGAAPRACGRRAHLTRGGSGAGITWR